MTTPTSDKLAAALITEGAPPYMITRAINGYYDDFKSPVAMPEVVLLADARKHGLKRIEEGVLNGEWDATPEESDAWAKSSDGQAVFTELLDGAKKWRKQSENMHRPPTE